MAVRPAAIAVPVGARPRAGAWTVLARFARKKPLGAAGGALMLVMLLTAIFAEELQTHDPIATNAAYTLGAPNAEHWLGMVIILGLVTWFAWIPPLTYVGPTEDFKLHAVQFLLPALAVGYRSSALIMRITRSSLLEVMREDYIRTAWAKGQTGRIVIWRHALKNALLPVVTVIGIEFAFLIGGLVVTETVFNLPGVARFLVQAILWRDYPIVQNLVMFIAIVVILSNLLVDMLYGVLDPRVRYGG